MNKDGLFSFLEKQLERVNYWLAFAEAKHAAVIALNIGAIAFLVEQDLFVSVAILILGIIISLLSFWPNLSSSMTKKAVSQGDNYNLLFYNDICQYIRSADEYLDRVTNKYGFENEEKKTEGKIGREYARDMAKEIIINSEIATIKYKLFRATMIIEFIAIASTLLETAVRTSEMMRICYGT